MKCLKGPVWNEHRLSKRYRPMFWIHQGESYGEAVERVVEETKLLAIRTLYGRAMAEERQKQLTTLGLKRHGVHGKYQVPAPKPIPKVPSWMRLNLSNVQRWEKHHAPWDREQL